MPITIYNTPGVESNLVPQVSHNNGLISTFTDPLGEFVVSTSGSYNINLPSGTSNGDFLQWNSLTNTWEPQVEQISSIQLEQIVQNSRLDAIEAPPNLPTPTTFGQYIYYDSNVNNFVVGGDSIILGSNSSVGATTSASNVFIGPGVANAGDFLNSVICGINAGDGCTGSSHTIVGSNIANTSVGPQCTVIGHNITSNVQGNSVVIGVAQSGDVGIFGIALGANIVGDTGIGALTINANTFKTDNTPRGAIHIVAELSSIKLEDVNIEASPQPTADGQRWTILSTDGTNYQSTDISKVYKNQRMFWTHYTKSGTTPITQVINGTTDFNLFDADARRLEYSPDGGPVGGGTTWQFDSVGKEMIWNGPDDMPFTIEVNMQVERINAPLCLARLLPVYNGVEIGANIEGNACQSRLSRNSSTSLHLSFVLSLQNGDTISFLLRKINSATNSNVRIVYSDIKIYSLRTSELADQITTDP